MSAEVLKALGRIEADIAFVRRELSAPLSAPAPKQAKSSKKGAVTIPEIAASYTPDEAKMAHQQIEAAYEAGLILYDKKRGMKMRVTKATVGWSADKRRAA
jgi:hypothetical protein